MEDAAFLFLTAFQPQDAGFCQGMAGFALTALPDFVFCLFGVPLWQVMMPLLYETGVRCGKPPSSVPGNGNIWRFFRQVIDFDEKSPGFQKGT